MIYFDVDRPTTDMPVLAQTVFFLASIVGPSFPNKAVSGALLSIIGNLLGLFHVKILLLLRMWGISGEFLNLL